MQDSTLTDTSTSNDKVYTFKSLCDTPNNWKQNIYYWCYNGNSNTDKSKQDPLKKQRRRRTGHNVIKHVSSRFVSISDVAMQIQVGHACPPQKVLLTR